MNRFPRLFRIQLAIFCILWLSRTEASVDEFPENARSLGMGSVSISLTDGFSIFSNPAGMSPSACPVICLSLFHPFGLKDLISGNVSGILPTCTGRLGLGWRTFGNSIYQENTVILGWANCIFKHLHLGIALRLNHLHIEKYGSDTVPSLDVGLLIPINPNLVLGLTAANISRSTIGRCRHPLSQFLQGGFSYKATPSFLIAVELNKDRWYPIEVRGGLEIQFSSVLCFRLGFGRNPPIVSSGFGIKLGKLTFDYGFSCHSVLGASHLGSLSIHVGTHQNTN
ncbi:hypothetical protein ACFL6A_02485 [bacterium]